MLAALLARQSLAGHAADIAAMFRQREEQHAMELQAAESKGRTNGLGGLIRILLTGNCYRWRTQMMMMMMMMMMVLIMMALFCPL